MYLLKSSGFINQFDRDIAEFRENHGFRCFLQILIDLSITRIRTSLSLFKGTLPACARNKEESLLWNNKFQVSGSSKRLLRFSYAVTIFLPLPRSRFKLCVNACETPEEKREGEGGKEQDTIGRRRERRERESLYLGLYPRTNCLSLKS